MNQENENTDGKMSPIQDKLFFIKQKLFESLKSNSSNAESAKIMHLAAKLEDMNKKRLNIQTLIFNDTAGNKGETDTSKLKKVIAPYFQKEQELHSEFKEFLMDQQTKLLDNAKSSKNHLQTIEELFKELYQVLKEEKKKDCKAEKSQAQNKDDSFDELTFMSEPSIDFKELNTKESVKLKAEIKNLQKILDHKECLILKKQQDFKKKQNNIESYYNRIIEKFLNTFANELRSKRCEELEKYMQTKNKQLNLNIEKANQIKEHENNKEKKFKDVQKNKNEMKQAIQSSINDVAILNKSFKRMIQFKYNDFNKKMHCDKVLGKKWLKKSNLPSKIKLSMKILTQIMKVLGTNKIKIGLKNDPLEKKITKSTILNKSKSVKSDSNSKKFKQIKAIMNIQNVDSCKWFKPIESKEVKEMKKIKEFGIEPLEMGDFSQIINKNNFILKSLEKKLEKAKKEVKELTTTKYDLIRKNLEMKTEVAKIKEKNSLQIDQIENKFKEVQEKHDSLIEEKKFILKEIYKINQIKEDWDTGSQKKSSLEDIMQFVLEIENKLKEKKLLNLSLQEELRKKNEKITKLIENEKSTSKVIQRCQNEVKLKNQKIKTLQKKSNKMKAENQKKPEAKPRKKYFVQNINLQNLKETYHKKFRRLVEIKSKVKKDAQLRIDGLEERVNKMRNKLLTIVNSNYEKGFTNFSHLISYQLYFEKISKLCTDVFPSLLPDQKICFKNEDTFVQDLKNYLSDLKIQFESLKHNGNEKTLLPNEVEKITNNSCKVNDQLAIEEKEPVSQEEKNSFSDDKVPKNKCLIDVQEKGSNKLILNSKLQSSEEKKKMKQKGKKQKLNLKYVIKK